jgi:hypothetical protein
MCLRLTITEAMRAVSDEYDAEMTRFASGDKVFRPLAEACLGEEYDEIDQELVGYVAEIASAMGVPPGTTLSRSAGRWYPNETCPRRNRRRPA